MLENFEIRNGEINVTPKGAKAPPCWLTFEQLQFLADNWESDLYCDGVRVHAQVKKHRELGDERVKEHLWGHMLEQFQNKMVVKIKANLREKGTSWITKGNHTEMFLKNKLYEYAEAEKWVNVANIAFMLYDRVQCLVPENSGVSIDTPRKEAKE